MSTHNILSSAASRSALAAAAPTGTQPSPAPKAEGEVVDVVTVADGQAAVAAAETRGREAGATAERERTAAVFASDEGKGNPAMAAFMLQSNPSASSDSIVALLKTMPTAAAPTSAPEAAAPPAPATPPITNALADTPKIDAGTQPNDGAAGADKKAIDNSWDAAIASASSSISGSMGAELAPGIPRTGN